MGADACKVQFENDKVESDCDNSNKGPIVISVKSEPLKVKEIPDISEGSRRKKRNVIKGMVAVASNCYKGKINGVTCDKPIEAFIFKWEKCPACAVQVPIYVKRFSYLKRNGIPLSYKILNVKDQDAAKLFQKAGCSSTPCVAIRDPSDPSRLLHISEGIDQDVGYYSSLFGIENPLIIEMTKDTIPTRLAKKMVL